MSEPAPPVSPEQQAFITELLKVFATSNQRSIEVLVEGLKDTKKEERVGTVPGKFKGERNDARRFITALITYFNGNTGAYNTEPKKLALAYGLCEDKAGQWVQPYMDTFNKTLNLFGRKKKLTKKEQKERRAEKKAQAELRGDDWDSDAEDDEEEDFDIEEAYSIETFEDFVVIFEETWFSTDQKEEAQATLDSFVQGDKEKIADYAARFTLPSVLSGYSQEDLLFRFRKGLKPGLKKTLAGWPKRMDTVPRLKAAAVKAERQYEEFVGNKHSYESPKNQSRGNWRSSNSPTTSNSQSSKQEPAGYGPMEVDAATIVCYKCYKEGHMRNECTASEQAPFRKVIRKSATSSHPKKVAATERGKEKPEFVEGSSKDGQEDWKSMYKEMEIRMGKMEKAQEQDF